MLIPSVLIWKPLEQNYRKYSVNKVNFETWPLWPWKLSQGHEKLINSRSSSWSPQLKIWMPSAKNSRKYCINKVWQTDGCRLTFGWWNEVGGHNYQIGNAVLIQTSKTLNFNIHVLSFQLTCPIQISFTTAFVLRSMQICIFFSLERQLKHCSLSSIPWKNMCLDFLKNLLFLLTCFYVSHDIFLVYVCSKGASPFKVFILLVVWNNQIFTCLHLKY